MTKKTRLAAVIAAMFAVPAGVVALEQSASSTVVEVSEPAQPVISAEQAPAPTEQAETVVTVEPAIPAVEERVRYTHTVDIQLTAIPHQVEPGNEMLPSQIAYLDRLAAQRTHLVARGDAFPASNSPEVLEPLPAQLAYFDRLDQTRLAAATSGQVARIDGSPMASAPATSGTGE